MAEDDYSGDGSGSGDSGGGTYTAPAPNYIPVPNSPGMYYDPSNGQVYGNSSGMGPPLPGAYYQVPNATYDTSSGQLNMGGQSYSPNQKYSGPAAPSPSAPSPNSVAWTPNSASGSGGLPDLGSGRITDPAIISQYVANWATQPQADPSLKSDPNYWVQKIISNGGLGSDNLAFWQNASYGPNAFYLNPNRESGTGGGGTWFDQNAPGPGQYTTPGGQPGNYSVPTNTLGTYTPAVWTEQFNAPTEADLLASPGFEASQQAATTALERSAAAKGNILSGGFAGVALPRALGQLAGQTYQQLYNNAFATYQQRYQAFQDANANNAQAYGLNASNYQNSVNNALAAFNANLNNYQTGVNNSLNQYNTRYNAYQDLIKNNLAYAGLGLNATQAGSPGASQ